MLRLSEAIRLGSMLAPQGFVLGPLGGDNDGLCALAAALAAVSETRFYDNDQVSRLWPWVDRKAVYCPAGKACGKRGAHYTTWHLNDTHLWTREQIADWVATVEPPDDPTPVPQPVELVKEEVPA